jgi:hypothetical protein
MTENPPATSHFEAAEQSGSIDKNSRKGIVSGDWGGLLMVLLD